MLHPRARRSLLLSLLPALGATLTVVAGCDPAAGTDLTAERHAGADAGVDSSQPIAEDTGASAGPSAGPSAPALDCPLSPEGTFLVDLARPATSYEGIVSTLSGSIYLRNGAASVVASTGASDPCYEDHGGPEGGGVWVFPRATNEAPDPVDFTATGGWTNSGPLTITPEAALAPDGVTRAQRLCDTDATGFGQSYFQLASASARTVSVWSYDAPDEPPTIRPVLLKVPFAGNVLPAAQAWARGTTYYSAGIPEAYAGLAPAGAGMSNLGVGAIYAWGYQTVLGAHDLPLITSGAASSAKTLDARYSAATVGDGDLDLAVSFVSTSPDWSFEPTFYLWSAQTSEGLMSVRWTSVGGWVLTVRGVDVVTTGPPNYSTTAQVVTLRAWYDHHAGTAGVRTDVNGSFTRDDTAPASGALAPPSTVYLGTNLGAATDAFAGRLTRVARPATKAAAAPPVEIVTLGDSIVGCIGSQNGPDIISVGSAIYTPAEALARPGIGTLAFAGARIDTQRNEWEGSAWRTAPSLRAVVIQVGVNDVAHGTPAATVIGLLQGLVDQVKADRPDVEVVLGQMLPARTYLDANAPGAYAVWRAVNQAIAGHGATPITGADAVMLSGDVGSPFNDGAGHLAGKYDLGDGLHTSSIGRAANAHHATTSFRAALHGLHLL